MKIRTYIKAILLALFVFCMPTVEAQKASKIHGATVEKHYRPIRPAGRSIPSHRVFPSHDHHHFHPHPHFRPHPHPHFFPPYRHRVRPYFPHRPIVYYHHHNPYHFYNGHFWRPNRNRFIFSAPPFGIQINCLPKRYARVFVGSNLFFYYKGTFYKQYGKKYGVVKAPTSAIVYELPEEATEVTVNGKKLYEYNHVLYKVITTPQGKAFKVVNYVE